MESSALRSILPLLLVLLQPLTVLAQGPIQLLGVDGAQAGQSEQPGQAAQVGEAVQALETARDLTAGSTYEEKLAAARKLIDSVDGKLVLPRVDIVLAFDRSDLGTLYAQRRQLERLAAGGGAATRPDLGAVDDETLKLGMELARQYLCAGIAAQGGVQSAPGKKLVIPTQIDLYVDGGGCKYYGIMYGTEQLVRNRVRGWKIIQNRRHLWATGNAVLPAVQGLVDDAYREKKDESIGQMRSLIHRDFTCKIGMGRDQIRVNADLRVNGAGYLQMKVGGEPVYTQSTKVLIQVAGDSLRLDFSGLERELYRAIGAFVEKQIELKRAAAPAAPATGD